MIKYTLSLHFFKKKNLFQFLNNSKSPAPNRSSRRQLADLITFFRGNFVCDCLTGLVVQNFVGRGGAELYLKNKKILLNKCFWRDDHKSSQMNVRMLFIIINI